MVPGVLYLPAFEIRFRSTCSTYVRSPKTAGRSSGSSVSKLIPVQRWASDATTGADEVLDQERLAVDRDAALDAAQGEQVLDDPVQAVGLDLDVVEQLAPGRRAGVGRCRTFA